MVQRPEDGPVRSARFCTLASLRWVLRTHAYTPWYLVRYWRFLLFKLRNPHVITRGFVFMDRGVEIRARRGYGRLILGRWIHLGVDTALRCHEGTLSLGDKGVLARGVSINCYLDVEIGDSALIADSVYISDFDHACASRATSGWAPRSRWPGASPSARVRWWARTRSSPTTCRRTAWPSARPRESSGTAAPPPEIAHPLRSVPRQGATSGAG